ncbi:putative glycerol-3-phosphate dehydrogenase, mitochondrial [Trichonephila clavipes]|nr:putative glycerol-3-phosphate dehydrogenase, mitochondrial [Trichonephila clavipes]
MKIGNNGNLVLGPFDESTPCLIIVLMNCQTKLRINRLTAVKSVQGEKVDDETLHDMLNEVDLNKNGQVELGEYLLLMSAIKTGAIAQSRLAAAVDIQYDRSVLSVDRSGGGV